MKTILSLKVRRYLTRIGVFLIAIALIAGLVSCEGGCGVPGDGVVKYSLTMAANPPAGGNATDLTGGSPYAANTSVNIQATANPGYSFVSWSAPAGAFGNATAATTTFTMPAQNVTVTANFALIPPTALLDHFQGYWASNTTEWLPIPNVYLEDQFGSFNATIWEPWAFWNPAEKWHAGNVTPVLNSTHHFTLYGINYTEMPQLRQVEVDNQFGVQNLTLYGPFALAVPTQKEGHAKPVDLDHYLLYFVENPEYQNVYVNLTDQWGGEEVLVQEHAFFANPVKKTYKGNVTDILNPEVHVVAYWISAAPFGTVITVDNQFGNQTLDVWDPYWLIVPSEKVVPPVPPLDHFKCYNVWNATPVMEFVDVMDQFGEYLSVMVLEAEWFCNPVDKNGEGMTNPDNHLTVYNISTGMIPGWWNVTVDNQFGLQKLTVYGPVALAAPTWKLYPNSHGHPMYLDHYLLYAVWSGSPVNVVVSLDDEFPDMATAVNVTYPRYFANPVIYKFHGGDETAAWDPEAHLVFYDISPNFEWLPWVEVYNQFEYGVLNLTPLEQLLAVPSDKWSYNIT